MRKITLLALCLVSAFASATIYTEKYEVQPSTLNYSWINASPYGVTYDYFPGRAVPRLAGQPITVLGSGDEGFIWVKSGVNAPGPAYGEPGTTYCDDNLTGSLVNAYGSGYAGYSIGMNFTNGPTQVYSLDFGYASGSNAPTHNVTVIGFNGGTEVWQSGGAVEYGSPLSLSLPVGLVDRIEIVRTQNVTALFGGFSLGWYTMDNLKFDATGAPGGYLWTASSGGFSNPVPEPASMTALAFGALALVRRRAKK
ncbi:MAG: PEP-CTERM sorting domain-containing protein [Fimbriimonas sp.]